MLDLMQVLGYDDYFLGWQQSQSPQAQLALSLQQSFEHSLLLL